jgi:SPW repeat
MTSATANERTSLGRGWVTVLLGVWLVISPFVLGFAHAPAGISNNVLVGLAIIACSFLGVKHGLLRAFNVLLAAWLYASAFILYVPNRAYLWNNLILAGAVILAAVAAEA